MKRKIIIAVLSAVFSLGAAEWCMRWFVVRNSGATDFESYRLRCLGKNISIFEAGASGEPVDLKPDSFQGGLIHINSQGFRGAPVVEPKPVDSLRICLIGGSGCFGTTSSGDATTIPGFLQVEMQAGAPASRLTEVMNGGMPGATTARAIDRYQTRLDRFKPDIVILYNLVNDMLASRRVCLGVDTRTMPAVAADGPVSRVLSHSAMWLVLQTFRSNQLKREAMEEARKRDDARPGAGVRQEALKKMQEAISREQASTPGDTAGSNIYINQEHLDQFRTELRRFERFVRERGSVPVFCTFAFRFDGTETAEQYRRDGPVTAMYFPDWPMARDAMRIMNDTIRAVARETGAALVDVDAELKRSRRLFPAGDTDHFTDDGCREVAKIIYQSLLKQNVISGAPAPR